MLISLQVGPSRYSELANRVHRLDSGISEKALTHTLRRLAEYRLVDRVTQPGGYALYSLTGTGEQVVPWLESFARLLSGAATGAPDLAAGRPAGPQPAAPPPDRPDPGAGRPGAPDPGAERLDPDLTR